MILLTQEIVTVVQSAPHFSHQCCLMIVAETKILRASWGEKRNLGDTAHSLFLSAPNTEFTSPGHVLMSRPEQFSISVYC